MTQHHCTKCNQRVRATGEGLEAELREYTEAERDAKQDVLSSLRVEYHNYTVQQMKLHTKFEQMETELHTRNQDLEAECDEYKRAAESWMSDYEKLKEKYEPMVLVESSGDGRSDLRGAIEHMCELLEDDYFENWEQVVFLGRQALRAVK